jgi:hypothetical protein
VRARLIEAESRKADRAASETPLEERSVQPSAWTAPGGHAFMLGTDEEQEMPGNPREMITMAERRFPVRIRIAVPPGGLGQRYARMTGWLDENCGADGWAMTPSGTRGVLNDAASIYFADATLAGAFVARWCAGYRIETAGGVFQVREDEPVPRVGARLHRTP